MLLHQQPLEADIPKRMLRVGSVDLGRSNPASERQPAEVPQCCAGDRENDHGQNDERLRRKAAASKIAVSRSRGAKYHVDQFHLNPMPSYRKRLNLFCLEAFFTGHFIRCDFLFQSSQR